MVILACFLNLEIDKECNAASSFKTCDQPATESYGTLEATGLEVLTSSEIMN